jgi:CPA1 family monovalent cation:H+ antiporter
LQDTCPYFRLSRLPYISWVVLFGAAYGVVNQFLLPGLPDLHLKPDVILYIFLPVLIFDASRTLDLGMARAEAVPSILLATLGILVSMVVMAAPLRLATDLPWIDVLFFTATMSATDPVAVGAVFKQFPIPGKLRTLIESESLLNDGTTVILFMLLGGKVLKGKELIFEAGVLSFIVSIAAAIVLGVCTGWFVAWLMRRWKALKDHFVGPLLPLLVVYLTFCVAQAWLEISGVIAVMAMTIMFRLASHRYKRAELPSHAEMEFYQDLWEFLGDLANAALFFMLGVEIGSHYGDIPWPVVPVVIAALLISRSVVVYGFGAAFRLLGIRLPMPWQHVMNLGGLKGALSVALVLMIPQEYAYRHLFLSAALAMCLFTLVANTLAMRAYLKKAGLDETG